MAATFSKDDPSCGEASQIVFIGNVGLHHFTEGADPRFADRPASAELAIDVIAAPGFESVDFEDIQLTLSLLSPPGALFTDHGNRNNYIWQVPDGAGNWVVGVVASRIVRLGFTEGRLLSGSGNGLTFYIGVSGVSTDDAVSITAVATSSKVSALARSCDITVSDLTDGSRIPGYLG